LEAQAQSLDFGGFVKAEYLHDSRQVVSAREGEFDFYPVPDSDATDVNKLGAFVFFSRLSLGIDDLPDVLGGEVSGFLRCNDAENRHLQSVLRAPRQR
jgi:hypothetical protein